MNVDVPVYVLGQSFGAAVSHWRATVMARKVCGKASTGEVDMHVDEFTFVLYITCR